MWLGHTQSLRACQGGLLLNVHPTPCAFWQAVPVLQFLQSAFGPAALNGPGNRTRAGKKLAGLKVWGVVHRALLGMWECRCVCAMCLCLCHHARLSGIAATRSG